MSEQPPKKGVDTHKIRAATKLDIDDYENPISIGERKLLESGLYANKIRNEAIRQEKFRDHFEKLSLCTLYLIWFILGMLIIVWIYDLLLPENLNWYRVSENSIDKIQIILTSSAVFGLAGQHLKKRVGL